MSVVRLRELSSHCIAFTHEILALADDRLSFEVQGVGGARWCTLSENDWAVKIVLGTMRECGLHRTTLNDHIYLMVLCVHMAQFVPNGLRFDTKGSERSPISLKGSEPSPLTLLSGSGCR